MAKIIYNELSCELIELTAEQATKFLEQNTSNRPLRRSHATRLMNQMLMGQWRSKLPIQIVIDKFGKIQNSQHCMTALVWAEGWRSESPENGEWCKQYGVTKPITIMAVVVTGIDPKDANLLDVGQKRTHGDVIFRQKLFEGSKRKEETKELTEGDRKKLANQLATAAKIVYFRTSHGVKVRAAIKFEHADLVDTVDAYDGLVDSALFVFKADKDSKTEAGQPGGISSRINPAYLMAAHFLAWHSECEEDEEPPIGKRRELADQFVDYIANGVGADVSAKDHPVHVLREWLVQSKANGTDGNARYDALILAWNAFIEQKHIKAGSLKCRDDEYPMMGGLDVPPEPSEDDSAGEEGEATEGEAAAE